MKRLLLAILLLTPLQAHAAASLADEGLLWTDPTSQSRVREAIVAYAITIAGEGSGVALHAARDAQAIQVLLDTENIWTRRFAQGIASQSSIAGLADANGATPLVANVTTCNTATPPVCTTTGNLSTQAALVTDAAITSAVASGWNIFIGQ